MTLLQYIENIEGCEINDIYTDDSFEFIKGGVPMVVTTERNGFTLSSKYMGMMIFDDIRDLIYAIESKV
jgi:hypothetical protein